MVAKASNKRGDSFIVVDVRMDIHVSEKWQM
jgi:hypothetical protein